MPRNKITWHGQTVDVRALCRSADVPLPEVAYLLTSALLKNIDDLHCGPDPIAGLENTKHELIRIARTLFAEFEAADRREAEHRAWIAANGTLKKKEKIANALRKAVFERDAYRCRRCGGWEDLCADHVVPESKGGPTTLENLQTLCRRCNSAKCNRDEGNW